ncbi:MAG: GAF domain-containing protein [Chloroflexi bacterium]|nr:MAG: GAF domain-containing protein [Chloroflexota bacterium]
MTELQSGLNRAVARRAPRLTHMWGRASGGGTLEVLTATEQFRERLELASRLGALASEPSDLAELFRALYDETAHVMDATVFLFALYDEASQTVEVVRQIDGGVEHEGGSFPLGKGFTSEVIRTAAPRLVRQWSVEGPPVRLLYGTEAGELVSPESAAVVPILSADHVLGVISVQSYRAEAYGEADILSLRAIATQAATAIKRLRATDQLALEHERHALQLEAVLASMNDALLMVDARGAIVRLNRAARELLRLDSASLVVGLPLERQRLAQWPKTAREIATALVPVIDSLRSGTSVEGVEIELTSDERCTLSVSASALRSPRGGPQGGVVVLHDITARRDLERLREDIFAMAWHDMQTPITLIRGHAELLLRRLTSGKPDPKATRSAAAMIVKHADRLAELLTTLFDVHCLEAGLLSISLWPTDLGALVRDVAEGLRPTTHHTINVAADGDIVGECDERRIRQVLMNLLSNAQKYSPEGSTVTVSVAADARSATISVHDEGIGLDETDLSQVFRRGYRAESARHLTGRGLGLYFGNGIVEAHGGRMWAESPGPGLGSTFHLALPLRQERETDRPLERLA